MARNVHLAGIRVRVTLVMVLATALSMLVLTLVVVQGVRQTLIASTTDYLTERLDEAQACVERGDLDGAIDVSGPFVLQVLNARGEVIASSSEALHEKPMIEVDEGDDAEDQAEKVTEGQDAASPEDVDDGEGSVGYEDDSAAQDAAEDAADAADAAADAAEDAADAAEDADDIAEDAAEAYEDAAEAQEDASDDGFEAGDGGDDDEDAYEAEDEWDADDAAAWTSRWFVRYVGSAFASRMDTDRGVSPEIEDIVASQLGVRGPYEVSTRQSVYRGEKVTLVALASLAEAYDAGASALRLLGLASAVVVTLAAALTWFLVGRTLRPVEQMRNSTLTIVQHGLSQRLDVPEEDPDLRELASTFNDLLSRAEQSLVEQRRFISDASHQLKSPIAAQRVMIETLRTHQDLARAEPVLNDLSRENNRLQGIVNDLLALARHDEGRVPTLVPVDLIDVVFEEASSLQVRSAHVIDLSGVEPAEVRGDAHMLGQAIRNLLDNADRYARSRIAVSCHEHAGLVTITVSDDGPGIPEADRERVFERFVRLDEGGELSCTSTGLGLAVVRGIVESHGGRVHLEETPGGGATAVIELPAVG